MICKVCKTKAIVLTSETFGDQLECPVCDKELCPDCGAHIRVKSLSEGGGVVCGDKCGYWFCF